LPTCLGSRSTQVRVLPLRQWVAIWDRAGLQNRPARFDSSAARGWTCGERASWSGTGPENQGDLRVRGSTPPLSSMRSGDDAHAGFARLFAKRVDHGPGGSTPLVSSALRWTEGIGGGLQNRLHAGSSPARSSNAPKVFQAARRLASSEVRVRLPLGARIARVADRHRHRPSKPPRRVRFPPRAQSCSLQGGCWHPSRPHKSAPVGSIPTPATGSDLAHPAPRRKTGYLLLNRLREQSALADRVSHVCKSAAL
jgi:hypothetical protein